MVCLAILAVARMVVLDDEEELYGKGSFSSHDLITFF